MKIHYLITALFVGLASMQAAAVEDDHNHDHDDETGSQSHHNETRAMQADEQDHDHTEEQTTRIEDAMASQVGIETSRASSQVLHQSVVAYGSLATGPEQLSHVRARYDGMIMSMKATLGDRIERGDLLAEVESNDSLKTYQMRAPITGTVIQRHANTGEVTKDQVLFSIADFNTLWAELRIYPTQQVLVSAGQAVRIQINGQMLRSTIRHLIPALDKPYQLARVDFDNRDRGLSPGLLVEGHIEISTITTKLAVAKDAIQHIDGQPGVFVKQGDEYQFVPVMVGRSDDRHVEVLSGLSQGQEYVTRNSYLIKADIEKSEAEHDH